MKNEKKNTVLSVLIGMIAALVMAIVLLYMMILVMFEIGVSTIFLLMIGCALPQCVSFLKKKDISLKIVQYVMIVLSYLITLIYGAYMSGASDIITNHFDIMKSVLILSSLIHGSSLIVTAVLTGKGT